MSEEQTTIDGILKQTSERLTKQAKSRRASFNAHRDIMRYAYETSLEHFSDHFGYSGDFKQRYFTVDYMPDWRKVLLSLFISSDDNVEAGYPVIDAFIRERRDMENVSHPPNEISGTILTWTFRKDTPDISKRVSIDVWIMVDRSSICKLVPTGEFTTPHEIMKLACG